jgi:CRISPR-associated protein Csx10
MECKRASVEHGLVDVLIDRYLATRPGAGNTEFERLEKAHRCQTCGQPRKRASGYRFVRERLPAPVRVQRMNVGIDRRTGSAAPHVLFGSQSLDPWSPGKDGDWHQATFSGMGYLEDDDLEVFLQLCEGPVFLGKYRSRGFGRVNLSIEPADDGGGREPGIEEGFARLKDLTGEPEGEVFTIDVTSPLLAFDRFLRPTSRPDEWLPRSLQAEVLTNMPTRTTVSGWDLACGMPKDDHPAVGAGSTLLARSRLARTDLARELAGIERVGIGERPEEGFGQIMVNDPFRFETQE